MADRKNSFITQIQTKLSITKSEAIIVLVLLSGLAAGTLVRYFGFSGKDDMISQSAVYKTLDSLAEVSRTTYTGTDVKNNPITELAKSDTVVAKESPFPKSKKLTTAEIKVNINSASKVELLKLPGVGEKTAINIIEQRKSQPFRKAEDIMKIKGIGPKKYAKMQPFIDVK